MLLWKNGLEDSVYVFISAQGKFYNEDALLPKELLFFFICSGPCTASISNVRLSFNISLFVMPHFKCSFMMQLIFYVWDAIFFFYDYYYYIYIFFWVYGWWDLIWIGCCGVGWVVVCVLLWLVVLYMFDEHKLGLPCNYFVFWICSCHII